MTSCTLCADPGVICSFHPTPDPLVALLEREITGAGGAYGRDFLTIVAARLRDAGVEMGLDVATLTTALVNVEENHLNTDCLSDQCDHPDGECPEYAIGCSDAAEIAREYAAAREKP